MTSPEMLQLAAMVLAPGGAAWVGVRVSVNGMREDIKGIKRDVSETRKDLSKHGERIATLEAKSE